MSWGFTPLLPASADLLSGPVGVVGTLAVTEADDTLSAAGSIPVSATASINEAADTAAGSASISRSATLSVTEANDTATGAGAVHVSATGTNTEAADTVSAAATVQSPGLTATLSVTEGVDTVSAAAGVLVAGSLTSSEGADTVSGSGAVQVGATLTKTEAADTATAAAGVLVAASATISEGADTVAGIAAVPVAASLVQSEAADTLTASGSIGSAPATATLNVTEAADTGAGAATVQINASAAIAEAADTSAGLGSVAVSAAANASEAADTITASGTVGAAPCLGTANITEVGDDCRRTNLVPNSMMVGAVVGVIGSGGALPTGWGGFGAYAGLNRSVVATGTLGDGTPYVDLRIWGTNSSGATVYPDLYFHATGLVPAGAGQTYTASFYIDVIAGSRAGFAVTFHQASIAGYTAAGSYIAGASATITLGARGKVTYTLAGSTVARVGGFYSLAIPASGTVDLTFRVAMPQLEPGSVMGAFDPTYGAAKNGGYAQVGIGSSAVMNEVADGLLAAAGIPIVVSGGIQEAGDSLAGELNVPTAGDNVAKPWLAWRNGIPYLDGRGTTIAGTRAGDRKTTRASNGGGSRGRDGSGSWR